MSRIGKNAVPVPAGVDVQISGNEVSVKGKLGQLKTMIVPEMTVSKGDKGIAVKPREMTKRSRQLWGLSRSLVRNMVQGVTQGYAERLEIQGVGYKAAVEGSNLKLDLGFSHSVLYPIPAGIKIVCEKPTSIAVSGIDRQLVGQVAAEIRGYKKPEPYKGKGIRYANESVRRKEGKKK
ncbi:MAG: 50S ribosomal protein L6 [Alphaproteobacteria bacterium]|nr:50S ribosomal protein L6 [Alphaproteobacteria bacterium]